MSDDGIQWATNGLLWFHRTGASSGQGVPSPTALNGVFDRSAALVDKKGRTDGGLVIYCDNDGSLKTMKDNHGPLQFALGDTLYKFDKRPGTDRFIDSLLKLAPTYVYTAASRRFAKTCLKLMGIYDKIDGLLSRENMHNGGFPDCNSFILVENDQYIADFKIECLNKFSKTPFIVNKNCWVVMVPDYVIGKETDDSVLQKALAKVQAIVSSRKD